MTYDVTMRARCGVRIIRVEGRPFAMGKQRGEQAADLIRNKIERSSRGLNSDSVDRLRRTSLKFEEIMESKFPDTIEELRGIAAGAKVSYEDLRFTLGHGPPQIPSNIALSECSCFAASREATADRKPIIAKNADLFPPRHELGDMVLVYAKPSGGKRYVAVGNNPEHPGNAEGLNEKGLALCGSGVYGLTDAMKAFEEDKAVGVPIHILQSVIYANCDNVEEASEYIKMIPRGYLGRNLLAIDKKGDLMKAELSFENTHIQYPEADSYPANWCVAGTSHFVSRKMSHLCQRTEESIKRYERWKELLTVNAGKINFDLARTMLKDHVNGPGNSSICRHGPAYTLGSYIIQPASSRLWVLKGYPCENQYEAFTL